MQGVRSSKPSSVKLTNFHILVSSLAAIAGVAIAVYQTFLAQPAPQQPVNVVVSLDPQIDADIPAMVGASAALALSGVPFNGPIGAARVGYRDGQYLLNPDAKDLKASALNLVVAGTRDGVMMVESEANCLSE